MLSLPQCPGWWAAGSLVACQRPALRRAIWWEWAGSHRQQGTCNPYSSDHYTPVSMPRAICALHYGAVELQNPWSTANTGCTVRIISPVQRLRCRCLSRSTLRISSLVSCLYSGVPVTSQMDSSSRRLRSRLMGLDDGYAEGEGQRRCIALYRQTIAVTQTCLYQAIPWHSVQM